MADFDEEVRARLRRLKRTRDSLGWPASYCSFQRYRSTPTISLGSVDPSSSTRRMLLRCRTRCWQVRPDLVIETGIAHGGSLMLSASMLALLDYCDAVEAGVPLDLANPRRKVIGIDIDIRARNRAAVRSAPYGPSD